MNAARYNKVTASVISGAAMAVLISIWPTMLTAEGQVGLQTLITAVGVWAWRNQPSRY